VNKINLQTTNIIHYSKKKKNLYIYYEIMPILVLIHFWVPPIQFELLFLSLMEQTQFFKLL
jgi:hypothetical protein